MDFGDAGDDDRGMAIFNHSKDEMIFHNWEECPKYIKTTLSELIDKTVEIRPGARVKCIVDEVITFQDSQDLRLMMMEKYNLREFTLEESREITSALSDTITDVDIENIKLKGVDELVVEMLQDIDTEHFENKLLIDIYQSL